MQEHNNDLTKISTPDPEDFSILGMLKIKVQVFCPIQKKISLHARQVVEEDRA